MLRHRTYFLLVSSALALGAQGIFTNVDKPGDPICPRVMVDKTALEYKSQYGRNKANLANLLYHQTADEFFTRDQRKDVAAFAAYDEHNKGKAISSLKGKVVLVGLWGTHCEPSASMLMEFAGIYAKRAQYGFELLAVNFDESQQDGGGIAGGWRAINRFKISNRQFFEKSDMPIYIPGLGKEGPSNFMDMVYSLPVLFVVDRQGKLAELHIGYKNGFVGEALKRALSERPEPAAPPAPAAPAVNPPTGVQ
jgi:thiol-disulfide isomerase/thioredoxin